LVKDDAGKGVAIAYHPGRKPGLYTGPEGGQYINTHKATLVRSWPKKLTKADIAPFTEFMEHLIPVEHDRKELERWCATLLAKPDVKMHYGVLLISETQGVGKGTLGEKILAPLVGIGNTSFPGEEEIVESKYNYWTAHRRLAVVHEIYAGHSSRAYNKLKSIITDFNIEVHRKYMADYRVDNWVHAFACSNSIPER
jgi:effector-binding domain-containing protein